MHLPCFSANGGTKGRRRLGIGIIMQQVLKCSCQPAGSDLSPTHPTNDSHDLVQSAASSSHNIITNTNTTTSGPMSIPRASSLLHEAADCSVAGILYKWVNMARGWRPRWFILKNGILSYYKVHGPDKITLSDAKHKTSQIIGGESEKLLKSQRSIPRPSKAFGELHLQVSSIRKSRSDEKKFYIFTGIKTLHLRAETREDRNAWVEALHAAKDYVHASVPDCVNKPFPFQIDVSTTRLRNRLLQEGLSENVIVDCETVMKMELSCLVKHLRLLENNTISLIERLKQLEGEKLELETTVVEESQSRSNALGEEGGSGADTDDERDVNAGQEVDSDEEDNTFFDTSEFLVTEPLPTPSNYSTKDSANLSKAREKSSPNMDRSTDMSVERVGFEYPHVPRRSRLPEPKEEEKSVSLWSIIKDAVGKDLTKICLPVYFNEPISSLQKCFEDLEYSYLLDRAYAWGMQGDHLMQMLNVAAFAVSGYSSTKARTCKPFNPLLGETYEADYPDKGLRFISEKVSHHPVVLACHCEGRGWVFSGDSNLKSKFWGQSIQLDPVGIIQVQFANGQRFQWSKVTTCIYNLIVGKLYIDHFGTMKIQGNGNLVCKLKFKEQTIMDRNPHQVQGYVYDGKENKVATLFGRWDEAMYFAMGDISTRSRTLDPMTNAVLLWRRNDPPELSTRYNLTRFAITLNEITPGLKEKLPPTDSRLRPDQRHLENGEYNLANIKKLRLEQNQRKAWKLQESGWKPYWFHKNNDTNTFEYVGGYWEAREQKAWEGCPNIFGAVMDIEVDADINSQLLRVESP